MKIDDIKLISKWLDEIDECEKDIGYLLRIRSKNYKLYLTWDEGGASGNRYMSINEALYVNLIKFYQDRVDQLKEAIKNRGIEL
jgi:hypothetical protein